VGAFCECRSSCRVFVEAEKVPRLTLTQAGFDFYS
jgi:hypothetical protein